MAGSLLAGVINILTATAIGAVVTNHEVGVDVLVGRQQIVGENTGINLHLEEPGLGLLTQSDGRLVAVAPTNIIPPLIQQAHITAGNANCHRHHGRVVVAVQGGIIFQLRTDRYKDWRLIIISRKRIIVDGVHNRRIWRIIAYIV